MPKVKNAVRIFVLIGGNAYLKGEEIMWAGMATISIAELLEYMGYSVSVVCCFGTERGGLKRGNTETGGARFVSFEIKRFTETIDTEALLYVTADPTFFRIKCFDWYIKMNQKYGDQYEQGLGRIPAMNIFKEVIFTEYGARDGLFFKSRTKADHYNYDSASRFLYFFIGGQKGEPGAAHSEQEALQAVRELILTAENENRAALDKLGYQSLLAQTP